MSEEEFIGKLQMVYVGDKNAFYEIKDYVTKLESKNEKIKEKLENDTEKNEDTISYQLGFDKASELYKSRIDKAIEYIKKFEYYIPEDDKDDLLNILTGGDEKMN